MKILLLLVVVMNDIIGVQNNHQHPFIETQLDLPPFPNGS